MRWKFFGFFRHFVLPLTPKSNQCKFKPKLLRDHPSMETFTFNSSAKGTWRLMRPTKNTNKKATVLSSKSNQCKFKPKLLGSSYPTHFKQFFSLSRMQINVLNKAHSLSTTQKSKFIGFPFWREPHTHKINAWPQSTWAKLLSDQLHWVYKSSSYPLLKQVRTETNIKLLKTRDHRTIKML